MNRRNFISGIISAFLCVYQTRLGAIDESSESIDSYFKKPDLVRNNTAIITDPIFLEHHIAPSHPETPERIEYISLGVVRFTKDVYNQMKKNYPSSKIHQSELIKSFDGKVRYMRPMRLWMLQTIKNICLLYGVEEEKLYLCMEE